MQLRTLIAQPPNPGDRDHSLRRLFFAINVSDQEKETFEQRYGVEVINGYGLSEAMVMLTSAPIAAPRRYPSIGLPTPGRRLLLLDEQGDEVSPGEVGEICVDGVPGRDVMLGYYKDGEQTELAFKGGVLHTGDNAYADESGYLYFFDRKKDMIKRAAENVSAVEVESVIVDHPQVAEVAVVGVPDDIRDEAVAAVIVRASEQLTEDDVVEFCGGQLSRFKVPTIVRFVDEVPKTAIGKVQKDELRKLLKAEQAPVLGDV
jgi:carnitine-CoA ligase